MSSYYLTTKGRSNIAALITKDIPLLNRWSFAPRFPFSELVDMCHGDKTKNGYAETENVMAGYFGSSNKVATSAYSIDLAHGVMGQDYDKKQ